MVEIRKGFMQKMIFEIHLEERAFEPGLRKGVHSRHGRQLIQKHRNWRWSGMYEE